MKCKICKWTMVENEVHMHRLNNGDFEVCIF